MPTLKNQRKEVSYCDHGHETFDTVRLMPLGSNANIIICRKHFYIELQERREHNREHPGAWPKEFLDVKWKDLKIYNPVR
jgi:hypothetical protein